MELEQIDCFFILKDKLV